MYRQLAIGYLNTGRDLRRMESNSRSPIFSGFGELLEGIVTVRAPLFEEGGDGFVDSSLEQVRAFSAERRFLDDLHLKIDITTKVRQQVQSKLRHSDWSSADVV